MEPFDRDRETPDAPLPARRRPCQTAPMQVFQNFVDGKLVDAVDGRRTPVMDPVAGEQYATAPLSSAADVDAAMRAAATAFETWRDTTPSERSLALLRIADAVEARADEMIDREVRNT